MVVLITGLCPSNCFYCPLSKEKLQRDRIFADEWELKNEKDTEKLFLEARYIEAEGAGITGGDPLVVWKRTQGYIKFLKEKFGTSFHIHLYTSGLQNSEHIEDLVTAGLDEIRFHPPPRFWDDMDNTPINCSIKKTVETNVDTAIEIPVIPKMEENIFKLIRWADQTGIKWVNLNELEFSETNADELIRRGFTVKNDISSAVKNSQETAYKTFTAVTPISIFLSISSSMLYLTACRNFFSCKNISSVRLFFPFSLNIPNKLYQILSYLTLKNFWQLYFFFFSINANNFSFHFKNLTISKFCFSAFFVALKGIVSKSSLFGGPCKEPFIAKYFVLIFP